MSLRENSAANDDIAMSIREALEHLQPNQALSLRRYYLEDSTLDMIAEELGVSRERARQIRVAGKNISAPTSSCWPRSRLPPAGQTWRAPIFCRFVWAPR